MESNYLIWSCNRKKFAKILTTTGMEEYSERLGWKMNAEWFIQITFYKDYIRENNFGPSSRYNVDLNLSLCREESLQDTVVSFKLLTNTTVQMEGQLHFSAGSKVALPIGQYNTSRLSGYLMDLIIIFPKNVNPELIPERTTLVSKDCDLKNDLVSMLEKEHLSDVILKCSTETLKAHKNILSARSPVFEAMFNSPMQENETDMVVIEDMHPAIFRSMMYFIYSGEVRVTSITSACDLLYAAEKYQLKGLKQVCVDYLKSVLSPENSIQVLEIADLYDVKLKRHVMSVVKDRFGDLENTKDWRELKARKPVLALEVYSFQE